ncbi:MAG: hypothetical protein RSB82_00655 [Victivallaceae bacterium]
MKNRNEQKILDSIKQILSIYKIDFDTSLQDSLQFDPNNPMDFDLIIQKTQEKIEELDQRTSEILKKTGMSQDQMETYIQNADNFSPEEWLALQNVKTACDSYKKETEELLKQIDQELGTSKITAPGKKEKSTKKSKKRNWIPM